MSESSSRRYTILFDLITVEDLLGEGNQRYIRSLVDKQTDLANLEIDAFVSDIIANKDIFLFDGRMNDQDSASTNNSSAGSITELQRLYQELENVTVKPPGSDPFRDMDPRFSKVEFLMFSGTNKNELISKTLGFGIIRLFIKDDENYPDYDESAEANGKIMAILAVPSYFSTPDLFGFIGEEARETVEHFRIFRSANPSRFMVLMKFKTKEDALNFQSKNNGREFSSLEPETCQVVNVEKVMFRPSRISSAESASITSMADYPTSSKDIGDNLRELPTCPICLERMDSSVTGLVTRSCAHTFHCTCLWKWKGGTCPVCRASSLEERNRNQGRQRRCVICSTSNNLWACLICGNIACGRYDSAHAVHHFKSTDHCYAIDLQDQSVWDYAEDRYVHRLIRNEADGKVVELPSKDDKAKSNNNNNVNNNNITNDSESHQGKGENENEALITALLNIIQSGNDKMKYETTSKEQELAAKVEQLETITKSLQAKHSVEYQELAAKMEVLGKQLKTAENDSRCYKAASEDKQRLLEELRDRLKVLEQDSIPQLEKNLKKTESKLKDTQATNATLRKDLEEEKHFSSAMSEQLELLKSEDIAQEYKEEIEDLRKQIQEKEEENRDLMFYIETLQKCQNDPDLANADVHIQQQPPQSSSQKKKVSKKSKKRLL